MNNVYTKCKACEDTGAIHCADPIACEQITLVPNYNYKKVWKYMRLFKEAQETSNDFLKHEPPTNFNLTQEEETIVKEEDKKKFLIPTTLYIQTYQKQHTFNPTPNPELYILIMEHDVQLRERNGFMEALTKYVRTMPIPFQKSYGEHMEAYAKNRMLNILAPHELWKAEKAHKLYIELEDCLKAFITTQILYKEE